MFEKCALKRRTAVLMIAVMQVETTSDYGERTRSGSSNLLKAHGSETQLRYAEQRKQFVAFISLINAVWTRLPKMSFVTTL